MERLQIALEKARASRRAATSSGTPGGETAPMSRSGRGPRGNWIAMEPLEIHQALLARNRVVPFGGDSAAAPFDLLRTRVLQQIREPGWRRIAVVSPSPGAGKTTMVANLAFALGRQSDTHTIALDFDLRRPTLAKTLGHMPRHNMAAVIEGRVPFADHGLCHGDNLIFGLNHEAARKSSELLQSRRTADLLAELEQAYAPDTLLFDMPPLLGSDDAIGFLRQVDCALIVAEAERTPISQLDAIERQVADITAVLGVVLNKCNFAGDSYGSDYGYY
ncbi:protein-tyrosine kinase [Rhodovulum iodosum]|uniref:Protein-tyrosine kinase n=1 Tax=Rhodovulum iodosum TaxID=68291 RepID=A0ABV3XXZ6_9RHOB|nr:CpsD/CapB family tyrosine-protein kinase [Rhodovulum robiginosum]RSK38868.1 exopolysaccharide biosynthesis protein [Rhodovulum robiginosum]